MCCRPPAALKTIKSLSAVTAGHMLLLEYLEERPLMMLQTGMGMRLTTYYRWGLALCGTCMPMSRYPFDSASVLYATGGVCVWGTGQTVYRHLPAGAFGVNLNSNILRWGRDTL